MSKTTTTIVEILQGGWRDYGYDDITFKNQILEFGDENALMFKIVSYDDSDFIKMTNKLIFGNYDYNNKTADNFVKRSILNKFANREIKFQTVDLFRQKLLYKMITGEKYITTLYNDFEKFLNSQNNGYSNTKDNRLNDTRNGFSDLPQDEVDYDVDKTILPYATNATYNRGRDKNESETNTQQTTKNPDNFEKMKNYIDDWFKEFDDELFLHTW